MSTARPSIPDRPARHRRRGFTVIEILVVVAVIIILLSILIVALGRAAGAAQVAQSRSLLGAISQSLIQFKGDVGYLPPVLNDGRGLVSPPDFSSGNGVAQQQDWFSITTLPDYLIGYGDDKEDSYDGLGIRSPGRDGVWGATIWPPADGSLAARNNESGAGVASTGQVLGPYLDLTDPRLLASIDSSGMIRTPSDPGYDLTAADQSAIIVDYWGRPIRYYRAPYAAGAIGQQLRPRDFDLDGDVDPPPTLGDVFVLRPAEVSGTAVDGAADGNGDTTTTLELKSAEFALLSFGPDGVIDPTVRRDADDNNNDGIAESNADNIVETGP